jgi:hypothetical protein
MLFVKYIFRIVKSVRVRLAGYVVAWGKRNAYRVSDGRDE